MPVLRIDATSQGLALHGCGTALSATADQLADTGGPAVIMVHGYKYAPSQSNHSPHKKIFNDGPNGWPAQLGFGAGQHDEGLAIAFGWYARGNLRTVFDRATGLGESLGQLVRLLKAQAPQRPVHIIAHSLGAQAALSALAHLPAGAVDRLLLLTGASYTSHAQAMLETPAGKRAEVFNITSRENDLFDLAFERLVPPVSAQDRAIGQGIAAENVCTLQLDCDATLAAFSRLGFVVERPQKRVCHWSAYKRQGIMPLYAALLRDPAALSFAVCAACFPVAQTPRWSRLAKSVPQWSDLTLPMPDLPLALRAGKRMMRKASLPGKPHEHAY